MAGYVLAIDQSTQGTKATLFDENGALVTKASRAHEQIVSPEGWVSHDPEQIMTNVLASARDVCKKAGVAGSEVVAVGISNQRETCLAWDRKTREPLANAIVWQCGRARGICERLAREHAGMAERAREVSGLTLSPYFSAAKFAWLLANEPQVKAAAESHTLCLGTIDSWLLFKLCEEHPFVTEPSNACRTQLLDIRSVGWSRELCELFGVPADALAEVRPSNCVFGHTTMGGLFPSPVPVCGVLGDSQAALMGQGCTLAGQAKATYGTGSSVMMQTADQLVDSESGLVASIAWQLGDKASYVLEGNVNYSGAVVSWMKDDARLISDPSEAEDCARRANPADRTYLVPAFTGLGAPWWDDEATAIICGMTRVTGRDELVRAGLDSIAYQIADVIDAMRGDTGLSVEEIRVDGGPTANGYLMQFQSDVARACVAVSSLAELSAAGAAAVAGASSGLFSLDAIASGTRHNKVTPQMGDDRREELMAGWHKAVRLAMAH